MIIKRAPYCLALFLLCILAAGGCTKQNNNYQKETTVKEIDLSQYKGSKPERTMKLLFIHHSCGGQWLADRGEVREIVPDTTILASDPNGGGLRKLLQENNFEVHEAAYRSRIGDKTDVCDWNIKFRDKMDEIIRCDRQDTMYTDASAKNEIIMFKSCFPANGIEADGKEPGAPDSQEKTTANYKAAYASLLSYFKKHPETLFVCVTAPPLAEPSKTKQFIKKLFGMKSSVQDVGVRARRFNNWLKDSENGWLAGFDGKNVVVFDYYNVLTGNGKSNYALFPTKSGADSHPSSEGNTIATQEFVPFLNKAVGRFIEGQKNRY